MQMKSTWLFVTSLAVLSISGALLLLSIPALLRTGGQSDAWLATGLMCLVLAGAAGARHWRPAGGRE